MVGDREQNMFTKSFRDFFFLSLKTEQEVTPVGFAKNTNYTVCFMLYMIWAKQQRAIITSTKHAVLIGF